MPGKKDGVDPFLSTVYHAKYEVGISWYFNKFATV